MHARVAFFLTMQQLLCDSSLARCVQLKMAALIFMSLAVRRRVGRAKLAAAAALSCCRASQMLDGASTGTLPPMAHNLAFCILSFCMKAGGDTGGMAYGGEHA